MAKGYKFTEEQRANSREGARKRIEAGTQGTTAGMKFKMSEETKRKRSEARRGKKLSPEAMQRRLERIAYMKANGIPFPSVGKKHTDEAKAKVSKANKGLKRTDEAKEKMRLAKLGKKRKPFTEEHLQNLSNSIKIALAKKRLGTTK